MISYNYSLVLTFSILFFPLLCFGNYETGDTIVLEALLQDVDNSDSATQGYKKFPWLVRQNLENLGTQFYASSILPKASIIKNGRIECAGALIDEIHVLSSSYCFEKISRDEISKLQVGIGYQTFGDNGNSNEQLSNSTEHRKSEGPYYVRRVKKVIMDRGFHLEFVPMIHSMAILKLDAAIIVNDFVEPLSLIDNATIPKHRITHPAPIKQAKLAGWRKGNENAPKSKRDNVFIRGVTLRLYNYQECLKEFNSNNFNPPPKKLNNIICANSPINNPCHYVLGTPLVTKVYGSIVVLGIREKDCSYPSVFTRIEYYLPWIRRNLYH